MNVITRQNDTLDEVCYRTFGRTDMIVEVIEQNPHVLCPALLPMDMSITLPDKTATVTMKTTIKLWD